MAIPHDPGGPAPPGERLTIRALRKRWAVADDKRPELVRMLTDMAMDPSVKSRQRITCVKTLCMLETLDLKAIEVGIKADVYENICDRIAALEEYDRRGHPRQLPERSRSPQAIYDDAPYRTPPHGPGSRPAAADPDRAGDLPLAHR